jgi:hypothetical protein
MNSKELGHNSHAQWRGRTGSSPGKEKNKIKNIQKKKKGKKKVKLESPYIEKKKQKSDLQEFNK